MGAYPRNRCGTVGERRPNRLTNVNHNFLGLSAYMGKRAPILIARKGIEILFGLGTFAILARTLPKEQFAIYSLVFGFIAILRLTSLPGIGTAVSQAFARSFPGGFRDAVKISFTGSLAGSLILLLAAWWHFQNEAFITGQVLIVTAICFPLVTGLTFWRNAAAGSERYFRLFVFDGLTSATKFFGVALCAYMIPGVLFPVVCASLLAPSLINVIATSDQLRGLSPNADRERESVVYGVRTTIYQLPSVLAQQLDKFVLFYFISPEALAVYAVALRIPELSRTVVGETNATLGPVFAREKEYTPFLYRFSFKLWLVFLCISVAGAMLIVPYLLPLLAGTNYSGSVFFAQIMTVGVALGYLGDIQFRYIKSHLHSQNYLRITLCSALLNGVLILSLAYFFGIVGVVAAYVLKSLGYTVITNAVIRFKYLNSKMSHHMSQEPSQP